MSGKIPFFPTPYPDETFYSVICRYDLLKGRNSFRGTSEELFGKRINLNADIPHCIGSLVKHLPKKTGLTAETFIQKTTLLPYYKPFISEERENVFRKYMTADTESSETDFFSLGIGKLRHPKNTHIKFCKECWEEDIKKYGEPYWHRIHQVPGVIVCPTHGSILMNSTFYLGQTAHDLFVADVNLLSNSFKCTKISLELIEKFKSFSKNCEWLINNSYRIKNNDFLNQRYNLWLRYKGFRTCSGRTWHKELYTAIIDYYGIDFLKEIQAYDEIYPMWLQRIMFYPDKMQHPMYHILLICFLAGSTQNFFEGYCPETLPYGKGPWPCRNKVCEYHLKDVIENIDIKYDKSFCRAVFKCPYCGLTYRRKKPVLKEKQYDDIVYISDYGWLWKAKLKEYITERKLTPRQTCRLLGCDFYTVDKYAVELGLWAKGDLTTYKKKIKKKTQILQSQTEVLQKDDYRKKWIELIKSHPEASRSTLYNLEYRTSLWLQKNDRIWYEENSPTATYGSINWKVKDKEYLKNVMDAISILKEETGKPKLISLKKVASITGLNILQSKKAKEKIPLTMAYLSQNIETENEWRKRKIKWAVKELLNEGGAISVAKILIKSSISREQFTSLKEYAQVCIDEATMKKLNMLN